MNESLLVKKKKKRMNIHIGNMSRTSRNSVLDGILATVMIAKMYCQSHPVLARVELIPSAFFLEIYLK